MTSNITDFGYLRVAASSPELRPADIEFNVRAIIDEMKKAAKKHCAAIVFPELAISSNSCGDLFFQDTLSYAVNQGLDKIAKATAKHHIVAIVGAPLRQMGKLFNCAVIISQGSIAGVVPKVFLCNSREYYEERWFSADNDRQFDTIEINAATVPFGAEQLFEIDGKYKTVFGIEICEDLWSLQPPGLRHCQAGANVIFNLSGSNEYIGKTPRRAEMVGNQSFRGMCAYVYSASGPGESTTDTLYSGHSMIYQMGSMLCQAPRNRFSSQTIIADLDLQLIENERSWNNSYGSALADRNYTITKLNPMYRPDTDTIATYVKQPFVGDLSSEQYSSCSEALEITTTALIRRLRQLGMPDSVIGISGGLDSTLALMICTLTYKRLDLPLSKIHAISMPGFGSSPATQDNAAELAKAFGVSYRRISIDKAVTQHFSDIGHNSENKDIVYENSQARQRTMILMDIANQVGGIVVGTGDMSEIALGWSTYNGDQMSMYNVNAGLPKTLVKMILRWASVNLYTDNISKLLNNICDTPISPELLPADNKGRITQVTEDSIGPYILHDFFLYYGIKCGFPIAKLFNAAQLSFRGEYSQELILKTLEKFYRRFMGQQFKRSAMPDGIKVTSFALSPRSDWRMPSDISPALWLDKIKSLRNAIE